VESSETLVARVGKAASRGNITDKKGFFALEGFETDVVAIDILGFEGKEVSGERFVGVVGELRKRHVEETGFEDKK